jgi:hypothetical protein
MSKKVQKYLEKGEITEAEALLWKDKTHDRQDALADALVAKKKGGSGAKVAKKSHKRGKVPCVLPRAY